MLLFLLLHLVVTLVGSFLVSTEALFPSRSLEAQRQRQHPIVGPRESLLFRKTSSAPDPHDHARSCRLCAFPWFTQAMPRSATPVSLERDAAKQELIDRCRRRRDEVSRAEIEAAIDKLAPFSPSKAAASSDLLQKEWNLLWTSEKEINVFLDWGIATNVTQKIQGSTLDNIIAFKNGGRLAVSGSCTASSSNPLRSDFEFTKAIINLDVSFLPELTLPPVGKGWFDTIYLDNELRVDINSRNDILICLTNE